MIDIDNVKYEIKNLNKRPKELPWTHTQVCSRRGVCKCAQNGLGGTIYLLKDKPQIIDQFMYWYAPTIKRAEKSGDIKVTLIEPPETKNEEAKASEPEGPKIASARTNASNKRPSQGGTKKKKKKKTT